MSLEILFFTSPSCNWCPYVEQLILEIIKDCPSVNLVKIDITEDIEKAEEYEVVALPTIILPSKQRIIGGADKGFLQKQLEFLCMEKK